MSHASTVIVQDNGRCIAPSVNGRTATPTRRAHKPPPTSQSAVAASTPALRAVSSSVAPSVAVSSARHAPTHQRALPPLPKDDESDGGERHASNTIAASTGELSYRLAGCSRIEASSTRGEQLSSSIGCGQQRSSRAHTTARIALPLPRDVEAPAEAATPATRSHGEHGTAELPGSRL